MTIIKNAGTALKDSLRCQNIVQFAIPDGMKILKYRSMFRHYILLGNDKEG